MEATCAIYPCDNGHFRRNRDSTDYTASNCCQAYSCTTGSGAGCKECKSLAQQTANNQCTDCNDGYTLVGISCFAEGLIRKLESEFHREDTVEALGKVANQGNDGVLQLLKERLADDTPSVRRYAAVAIGKVANQGDDKVLQLLVERLADDAARVRHYAAEAFVKVADPGDPDALQLLYNLLEHEDWHVRRTAIEAIGKVAQRGNAKAVALLGKAIADKDDRIRWKAVQAMGKVAPKGDAHSMGLIAKVSEEGAIIASNGRRIKRAKEKALKDLTL